jgi:antitoxin (DNA-binding transcriptional repressor) of toxin-antitoxin stability system
MHKVNVHEAKTHLSRLIDEALRGKQVVICRGRTPVVALTVVQSAKPKRVIGSAKGLIEMSPDFDAPLSDFEEYRK